MTARNHKAHQPTPNIAPVSRGRSTVRAWDPPESQNPIIFTPRPWPQGIGGGTLTITWFVQSLGRRCGQGQDFRRLGPFSVLAATEMPDRGNSASRFPGTPQMISTAPAKDQRIERLAVKKKKNPANQLDQRNARKSAAHHGGVAERGTPG